MRPDPKLGPASKPVVGGYRNFPHGSGLIKDAVRLVPPVQHVLDPILFAFEPQSNGSFVPLPARIALRVHLHRFIVSQTTTPASSIQPEIKRVVRRLVAEGSPELMRKAPWTAVGDIVPCLRRALPILQLLV